MSPLATPATETGLRLGGKVLFHRRETTGWLQVYVLDLETQETQALTEGEANNYDPAWSPDGTQIAFISDRSPLSEYGTLWLMDADGTHQRSLLEEGNYIEMGPSWSPDGTRIAIESNRPGKVGINPEIFIVDVASGELTNLTQDPAFEANPAWSPDGAQIAFVSDRSGNAEIWVVNVDGSGLRQVTNSPTVGEWRPAWSPDGRSLAYESFPMTAPRVLMMQRVDEGSARKIDTFSIWNQWPAWVSADILLFAASETFDADLQQASPAHLYALNLTSGQAVQLTSGPEDDGRPSWRP